jgi:hypothetical protein
MLASDPHIMSAVIFGDKQTEPGLLVEPRSAFQLDTTDANQVAVYLDLIWCVLWPLGKQNSDPLQAGG